MPDAWQTAVIILIAAELNLKTNDYLIMFSEI